MSEPFLAEIRIVGFTFAPRGWAFCDGQILPINQYQSLYSLLGTTYGGDGRTTFALPDLRGRVPLHVGTDGAATYQQGQRSGAEAVAIDESEMPAHSHDLRAYSDNADTEEPQDAYFARAATNTYAASGPVATLRAGSITFNSGGQGHENMQPYLALNFCIALTGLFPSRN